MICALLEQSFLPPHLDGSLNYPCCSLDDMASATLSREEVSRLRVFSVLQRLHKRCGGDHKVQCADFPRTSRS